MPFKTYYNWLFDGHKDSQIPSPRTDDNGKDIVPDILKYNSPITNQYAISVFLKNLHLNKYLDQYFNNINLYSIPRDELLKFIKRCVLEFRIGRYDPIYYRRKYNDKLYEIIEKKFPHIKSFEIEYLCSIINKSDKKDSIYKSLGLDPPKRQKIRTKKRKQEKKSLKDFLAENFSIMPVI
jgi:hypothetical protein